LPFFLVLDWPFELRISYNFPKLIKKEEEGKKKVSNHYGGFSLFSRIDSLATDWNVYIQHT
jgi:hypothetical protein